MASLPSREFKTKSGLVYEVRSPHKGHARKLLEHAKASMAESEFLVLEPEEFALTLQQEEAWLAEVAAAANSLALIAEAGGEIFGFLDFHGKKFRRQRHWGEFGISVRKAAWGQGIGQALMQTFIEWAKAQPDLRKLNLVVLSHNQRALRFYEKLGFQMEGRRLQSTRLKDGTYVDDCLMGLVIR